MARALRIFLGTLVIASGCSSPAHAQRQCEWDGERTICTSGPSGPTPGRDFGIDLPPPPDPLAEKLRADLQAFGNAARVMSLGTSAANHLLALPEPTSEAELSQRIDTILAAVWPEFSVRAVEAERLRQQAEFYEARNEELIQSIRRTQDRLAAIRGWIDQKTPELASMQRYVVESRRLEVELTGLALARINDRTSERRAIATLLAFAPDPRVSAEGLTAVPPLTALPGASPPQPSAVIVAEPAAVPERVAPEEFELKLAQPQPHAPIEQKLATMWTVGVALQYDEDDIGAFQGLVPARRAQYETLLAQGSALDRDLAPLEAAGRTLEKAIERAQLDLRTSVANHFNANTLLVGELVVDMALDRLSGEMRAIVDEVAGSEGLEARVPSSRGQALLDFARRGGRLLLPVEGYAAQWEAFVEAQEKTLAVLGRAQGYMSEAVEVLGRGSPQEIEAVLERVFASVRWQSLDYIKNSGFGALPEGEGRSTLLDAMERLADKRRQEETGE